jgi:hypothetical protein
MVHFTAITSAPLTALGSVVLGEQPVDCPPRGVTVAQPFKGFPPTRGPDKWPMRQLNPSGVTMPFGIKSHEPRSHQSEFSPRTI